MKLMQFKKINNLIYLESANQEPRQNTMERSSEDWTRVVDGTSFANLDCLNHSRETTFSKHIPKYAIDVIGSAVELNIAAIQYANDSQEFHILYKGTS